MSTIHPWVILFDIDGTLLTVKKDFNRPLIRRILDELGINYPNMEKDVFSGRTDHDILTSFLINHTHDPNLYKRLKESYVSSIEKEINQSHIMKHPYADESILFFHELKAHIGLLTGNIERAAKAKLKAAEIHYDFKFGAFGEFEHDRNQLPAHAVEMVSKDLGINTDPGRCIVIGDTPRDIECAKYAGMRCVAVTTGKFTKEELMELDPDLVLPNLCHPERWFPELISS